MKFLKFKQILYLFFTLAIVGISFTSCERETIIENELDGVQASIVQDELDGLIEIIPETDKQGLVEQPLPDRIISDADLETTLSAKSCSTIPSSQHNWTYRSCTSKFVYAFGTGGDKKKFVLYEYGVNGPVQTKYSTNYYTSFGNLKNGVSYQYKVYRVCGSQLSSQTFSVGIGKGGCK